MKVYPLHSINVQEAKEMQFNIVDEICKNFNGNEILSLGDLGVKQPNNKPDFTLKVEQVICNIFSAEKSKLVIGSGTGAIRFAIHAILCNSKNRTILIHDAPIYPTTQVTFEMFNVNILKADFNNVENLKKIIVENEQISCCLIQITRQKLEDKYDAAEVIKYIKKINVNIKIITDDNYAVFKTGNIGTQIGADLSTFSTFKLGGPEGVGCIVGNSKLIKLIENFNYSGGSQIQGWQAYNVLQAFVQAPVMLAIQAEVVQEIVKIIEKKKYKEINKAFVVNSQSKVVIIEFNKPIAKKFLSYSTKLGALCNPVGAESKYEMSPLFYRVSSTFRAQNPDAEAFMIRINPNRAGVKTIIRILESGLNYVSK